jgi:hypothetical protein
MTWTAELTNDPDNDFRLYLELLEDDEFRGRIERREGKLTVILYSPNVSIPGAWLRDIMARAELDLVDAED